MKEQIQAVINWLKEYPKRENRELKGCITGSCLLDYFEGQDVDIFVYDEKSFNKLLFAMHYDEMFQITDPLEDWKFNRYVDKNYDQFKKIGLITIKFTYNTCVPVNIILKKNHDNIFSILSSFDMDIVAKGYDIQSGKYLDLSQHLPNKKATWNRWNDSFYNPELWQTSKLLRQLERIFKYYKRGYNTDEVVLKYIELIDKVQHYQNIFNSKNFEETLKIRKQNTKIIRKICEKWLETHTVTDEQVDLLKQKINEI